MNQHFQSAFLAAVAAVFFTSFARDVYSNDEKRIQVEIDARDLPRKLLSARLEIPLSGSTDRERTIALWYPKWIPGSHGPGGPIANVAGLRVESTDGKALHWIRSPGEVYRIEVTVPKGYSSLLVWVRYITNQPTTGSMGHDSWGSSKLGVISNNTILLYPEGMDVEHSLVDTTVLLPHSWKACTALPLETEGDSLYRYKPVPLSQFVDSPIMCGAYQRTYSLVEEVNRKSPSQRLCVFADQESATELNADILKKYQAMVTQTSLLMQAHPFDQFDILLGITDALPPNGLEHSRSTFNILPTSALSSPTRLKGWNRLLVPHEYLHAWCGKYRRPASMITRDFHTPIGTDLLWVYEGLTQYLGELIEARCGLMSQEEFKHRLLVELRNASRQQGRQWRTLADTGAAAHILRGSSESWPTLRRSQDFYMEGMLFWMEADALIRNGTQGQKSLDDFCRAFFQVAAHSEHPKPYRRDDLVDALNSVFKYDWSGLISRRVESTQSEFEAAVAGELGYQFIAQKDPVVVPQSTFRSTGGIDLYDSLGLVISNDGTVRNLLLGSPADRARMQPSMKIVGVGDFAWSASRLHEAIQNGLDGTPISLKYLEGDVIRTLQIHYYGGPRMLNLVRTETSADRLADILKPLVP